MLPDEIARFVRQLIQNAVFFSGLIFAQQVFDLSAVLTSLIGYFILSTISLSIILTTTSTVYKQQGLRLPAHSISHQSRKSITIPILVLILLVLFLRPAFGLIILAYFVLGLAHETIITHIVLLDVISLGLEFSMKAAAGAAILDVSISPWLLLCTFLIALIVALGKRRNEIAVSGDATELPRLVLLEYNPRLLDQMLAVVTSSAFIAYALYTISEHARLDFGTTRLLYSLPFVLYGILRYLYLVNKRNLGRGSELVLLRDLPSMLNLLFWLITVLAVIYVH